MSYDAEKWARSQKVGNSSAKFVLIELANALNRDSGKCYPSIDALEEATELNRKTVIAATKLLEEKGFITKRRTFVNGRQIIFYGFPLFNPNDWCAKSQSTKNGTFESTENGTSLQQSTENGTLQSPKNGTDQSTENGIYESTVFGPVTRNKNKEIEQGSICAAPATTDVKEKHFSERGSRLTLTELPNDWKAFADKEDSELDPYRLFDNFHDYWTGLSGSRAIKKDWSATWRNFVRSFKNSPDWKRRPMLKPEAASREQYRSKFTVRETPQSERVYGL